jgi:hypothetical protein
MYTDNQGKVIFKGVLAPGDIAPKGVVQDVFLDDKGVERIQVHWPSSKQTSTHRM